MNQEQAVANLEWLLEQMKDNTLDVTFDVRAGWRGAVAAILQWARTQSAPSDEHYVTEVGK